MASPSTTDPVKAACSRCHDKKIKCDGGTPRCGACEKVNAECTVSTSVGSGKYDLRYITSLQDQVRALEARETELKNRIARAKSSASRHRQSSLPEATDPSRRVHDHGMGFIDLIFAKIRREVFRSSVSLYYRTRQTLPAIPPAASHGVPAAPPVGSDMARWLFDTYIRRSHCRHPFLPLATLHGLRGKTVLAITQGTEAWSVEESFRAHIILAIGLVYRKQELSIEGVESQADPDPLELFTMGLRNLERVNLSHAIEGVQNLLLIARFGFFYAIGMSTWDISSVCLRICIECGFHRQPSSRLTPMEEQMQRRVFWQTYNLDRYSSATLGRAFGIPDDAITVLLPANVDDATLIDCVTLFPGYSLDELMEKQIQENCLTDMTLSNSHTRLRQISSDMFRSLRRLRYQTAARSPSPARPSSSSHVFDDLAEDDEVWNMYCLYADKLQRWQQSSKRFGQDELTPGSTAEALMQDTRWIDLHFYQEKLALIRLVIEPGASHGQASRGLINALDLVDELYDAASNSVVLYSQLIGDAKIEPSTGRLYRVLTAGLSILYTVVAEFQGTQNRNPKDQTSVNREPNNASLPRAMLSPRWLETRIAILRLCTNTLARMARLVTAEQLTPKYVPYFDLLCREVLRSVSKMRERSHMASNNRLVRSQAANNGTKDSPVQPATAESPTQMQQNNIEQPGDMMSNNSEAIVWATPLTTASTTDHTVNPIGGDCYHPLGASSTQNLPWFSPLEGPPAWNDLLAADVTSQLPTDYASLRSTMPGPLSWPDDLSSEPITAPLMCQHPVAHHQPCCCGLMAINDVSEGVDNWWPADPIGPGSSDLVLMNGGNEQDLGVFVNEWESSGVWQSLLRQSSDWARF